MPHIHISDIDLYYEQLGSGPDLVLIGGAYGNHSIWNALRAPLKEHFRITVFDNRGCGQSTVPDGSYTTAMLANDTVALMDALEIEQAHVIGHSMGGMIAQQVALLFPDRVDHLVLCNCEAKLSPVSKWQMRASLRFVEEDPSGELLLMGIVPWAFGAAYLNHERKPDLFIQASVLNPYPAKAVGFKQQVEAAIAHELDAELRDIQAPTLIIVGEEDILTPKKQAQILAKRIPNSQLEVIPAVAHLPFIENTPEFVDCLLRFLK